MVDLSHRFAHTQFSPYWQETVPTGPATPHLAGEIRCDLAIIGAGFTGLWAALKARERHPDAHIVVLEARQLAEAASGRNGGFCAPSISHGIMNAVDRWPDEAETLVRLGRANLDELAADLRAHDIDAEFERSGKVNIARTAWEADGLKHMQEGYARFGIETRPLIQPALGHYINSPLYPTGLFEPNYAFVNPAKLVHGLAKACRAGNIPIYEQTNITSIKPDGQHLRLTCATGTITADRAILATNADLPLLRRLRSTIIPIYDYTIMTEPLTDEQLAMIGWQGRHGVADCGNQFHYSRKTRDNRILWGGYDAIYHYGGKRDGALLNRNESYARLEKNFLATFPSLANIRFSHAWGGIIDTSARLTFFTGTAMGGRLAYALGFTGQGVSATRFAALSMLDLLDGLETERTRLAMTRSWPVPFPPEPLRNLAINWAQRDLAREDQTGHRSCMLRLMDRLGIGFGS